MNHSTSVGLGEAYITHEGVERAEGSPSCAKSFGCVLSIAANVSSNHRNMIHAGETKDAGDRFPVMFPQTEVVSQPFSYVLSSTGKRRTGDNERPLSRSAGEKCVPCCRGHHSPVHVI